MDVGDAQIALGHMGHYTSLGLVAAGGVHWVATEQSERFRQESHLGKNTLYFALSNPNVTVGPAQVHLSRTDVTENSKSIRTLTQATPEEESDLCVEAVAHALCLLASGPKAKAPIELFYRLHRGDQQGGSYPVVNLNTTYMGELFHAEKRQLSKGNTMAVIEYSHGTQQQPCFAPPQSPGHPGAGLNEHVAELRGLVGAAADLPPGASKERLLDLAFSDFERKATATPPQPPCGDPWPHHQTPPSRVARYSSSKR